MKIKKLFFLNVISILSCTQNYESTNVKLHNFYTTNITKTAVIFTEEGNKFFNYIVFMKNINSVHTEEADKLKINEKEEKLILKNIYIAICLLHAKKEESIINFLDKNTTETYSKSMQVLLMKAVKSCYFVLFKYYLNKEYSTFSNAYYEKFLIEQIPKENCLDKTSSFFFPKRNLKKGLSLSSYNFGKVKNEFSSRKEFEIPKRNNKMSLCTTRRGYIHNNSTHNFGTKQRDISRESILSNTSVWLKKDSIKNEKINQTSKKKIIPLRQSKKIIFEDYQNMFFTSAEELTNIDNAKQGLTALVEKKLKRVSRKFCEFS